MDGIAIKAMVSELAPVVREYVEAAQAPLLERIAALETEKGSLAARCEALEESANKAPEIDLTGVEKLIEAEIAKLPTPEPAKEIDREELAEAISVAVSDAVAALPPAQDGKSVEIDDMVPIIVAEVAKAVEALPVPKDGEPGHDGRGIKDLLIDRDGNLVATMDDGEMKSLGPVCGKDGENGQPGLGFEDLDACVLDDDRTIELSFRRGDEEKAFTFKWPTCIYRNVFKEGEQYERGDMVTWGGSLWHCDAPTKDKPGTESWTLAAKKGRDGKDAKSA